MIRMVMKLIAMKATNAAVTVIIIINVQINSFILCGVTNIFI